MKEASRELAPATPARRALHVVFCVDCSGSMAGDRIAAVNDALRSAVPAMRAAAEDNAEIELFVRALAFADKPEWRVAEPATGEGIDLVAGGETNMGLALRELADALSSGRLTGPQAPPVLILICDGLPTDDAESGLAALARVPFGASALRIAIAVGSDADRELLQSFVGECGLAPLQANNAEMLRDQIGWAASALVKATASPAGDSARRLAAEAARRNQQIGELLW